MPVDDRVGARMLVVDDDPRGRKLLQGYLLGEGHEVRCAEDGPGALTLAREWVPDVVLLDVMMPGMTGYEVCRVLKTDPRTRLSQVMLVTALDGAADKVEGLDLGADDHVAKPVRRDQFLAKVRALLRVRKLMVELERARSDLAVRNEELQLKKTLAQSLVHDLKSPLSAILGNLDLLEMRGPGPQLKLVQRSRRSAKRMLEMILDLLDVEGLEEGQLKPDLDRVDAGEIARAAVEEASGPARQREVRIELHACHAVWATADPVLLRRVLDNLLSNAAAHSPAGSTVGVAVGYRDEGVELAVCDNGPGIPEQDRESVFEKYAQLKKQGAGRTQNRGLGLTFCRLAVEAQGGTIWVESAATGGARFVTLLPSASPVARQPALVGQIES